MTSYETRILNKELALKGLKYCIRCEKELPFSSYGKDNSKKNGLTHTCVDCKNSDYRMWTKTDPNILARSRKFYHDNKPKYKNWELKRVFGITLEEYENMLQKQNNVCAICFNPETSRKHKKLSVDHCHTTKKVRGLLCSNCNLGIGNLQDSTQNLRNAIKYLEGNKND